jgi:hypothetical protein
MVGVLEIIKACAAQLLGDLKPYIIKRAQFKTLRRLYATIFFIFSPS